MGTVYLTTTRGGQPVALKTVHPELASDPKFRRRFEREVRAARGVRGRYVVPVLDSSTEGPAPWLVTEYAAGPSLSHTLAAHGPLPPDICLRLMAGAADALLAIHTAHVIHRDLKPANILLCPEGPAVIDFGIARAAEATPLTGTDTRIGTPAYMAPEQISGGDVTPAVDLFALGLTVHLAAAGVHPYGEGPNQVMLYRISRSEPDLSRCPDALRPLVRRCLAREPAERPGPAELMTLCFATGPGLGLRNVLPAADWLPPRYTAAPAPLPTPRQATAPWPAPAGVTAPWPAPAGATAPWPAPHPATPALPPPPDRPPPDQPPDRPPGPPAPRRRRVRAWVTAALAGAAVLAVVAAWFLVRDEGRGEEAASSAKDQRLLAERVAKGLENCGTAKPPHRIEGARVTLRCYPRDDVDVRAWVSSFSNPAALDRFITSEKKKAGPDAAHKLPRAGRNTVSDWRTPEGIRIGTVVSYTDDVGLSWITWTFEHDPFVDKNHQTFSIKANSPDQPALTTWWHNRPA